MKIKHVLVTAFNNRLKPGTIFTKALDSDWLKYRWEIFNTFTVPSVAAQTCTDFEWVILCHEQSPSWLKNSAKTFKLPCQVRFSFRRNDPKLDDLKDSSFDAVLTTRIDSDDAWHRCAMARIREQFEADPFRYEILNFKVGYYYDALSGQLALTSRPSPPFSTKVNLPPISDPLDTGGHHDKLPSKYSYKAISQGDPMYLRVLHSANSLSRVSPQLCFVSRSLSQHILQEAFSIEQNAAGQSNS
jgi:Putative rhamnosyl transferase